jgi:hypothetical protein
MPATDANDVDSSESIFESATTNAPDICLPYQQRYQTSTNIPDTMFAQIPQGSSLPLGWDDLSLTTPQLDQSDLELFWTDMQEPHNVVSLHDFRPDWGTPSRMSQMAPIDDAIESAILVTNESFGWNNGCTVHGSSLERARDEPAVTLGSGRLREMVNASSALSTYFFRDVLSRYCTWDSSSSSLRIIIESTWQSSGALYHTMQSMAAACLSKDLPHLAKVAKQERALALESVRSTPWKDDRLLAVLLLGTTSCWIDPTDVVPEQFREVWTTIASCTSLMATSLTISFVQEALGYWTMILAFITDTEQLGESKVVQSLTAGPVPPGSIIPNPFSGISPGAVRLFTDTGRLIYKVRKRLPGMRFVRTADLLFFQQALEDASRLERRILAYVPLDVSKIGVLGDPHTTPMHFQIVDNAFRYTALLQLYRMFPDLLSKRYRPWDVNEILLQQPASHAPSQEERSDWLTRLALYILDMLQEIPQDSRTRSIQPPVLVAVSSELRYDYDVSCKADMWQGTDTATLAASSHSIDVARARRFVILRLSTFAHVLPILKIKRYKTVVTNIWEAIDAGARDVYWVDVACDERLRTVVG